MLRSLRTYASWFRLPDSTRKCPRAFSLNMELFETYLGLSASKICSAIHDTFCFSVLNTLNQSRCALAYVMDEARARDLASGQVSCRPAAGKLLFQDNGRQLLFFFSFSPNKGCIVTIKVKSHISLKRLCLNFVCLHTYG